ncbi:MAG: hypothetical protein ACRDRL_07930, partial [Sciscionella sp.]
TLGTQGPSVYLLAYYLGSSVGGTLGGLALHAAAWPGITIYCGAFVLVILVLAVSLWRLRPAGSALGGQQ